MILKNFKTEEELKTYLKEIFDYCMEYKWDTLKLKQLGKYLKIEGITVSELAKMSINYQGLSDTAKKILYDEIEKLEKINQEKYNNMSETNPILKEYGIITYQKWNNEEEKGLVLRTIYNYSIEVKFSREKLEKLADSLGITYFALSKDITEYATNYLNIKKEDWYQERNKMIKEQGTKKTQRKLKQGEIDSLKKIYEYCEKYEYEKDALERLSQKIGVTPSTIMSYNKLYATNCLGLTIQEYNNHKKELKKKKQAIKRTQKDKEVRLIARLMRTEATKEGYLKYIYEYCESVKYKKSDLTKIATKLEVNETTLIAHAQKYAQEYLGLTKEEWQEKRRKYRRSRAITPIKQEQSNKSKKIWKNDEEKEIILKEIYETCELNNYSNETIDAFAEKYDVKPPAIINLAKRYALEYLNISEEAYRQRKYDVSREKLKEVNKAKVKSRSIIYQKLLKANDLSEIINIIETSGFDYKYLKAEIDTHVRLYNDIEDVSKLKEKFEIYYLHLNELRKEIHEDKKQKDTEEKTNIAKECINKFITSDCLTKSDFCKKQNIERTTFRQMEKIVKEKDEELYKNYQFKLEENNETILKQLETIVYLFNNGINESNITREFDLVDYYLITSISLNEMLNYTRENKVIANLEVFLQFKEFAHKNINGEQNKEREIEKLMNEFIEIDFQLDEHGKPIPGTGKSLSQETKIAIINFLKENNIPINSITYSLMIKRYRLGIFNLTTKKILSKTI